MLRVLHTSDWHLGRLLYGRKRYEEFDLFLAWLVERIEAEKIEVLLLAGDIFDTSTPSNRAQAQYYRFLSRVSASGCRHVVVIGGNHDSPTFLDAPRQLLAALSVHVVGAAAQNIEDEVLVLNDSDGQPELIVCAVPYLRDRDIRQVEAGESIETKEQKLLQGIREHYAAVGQIAERRREEAGGDIAIIGMGHLFTAGAQTIDGDGVRELYIGSLAHVSGAVFPDCFDYLALGHLHVPQKVGGSEQMRYSGSPLPMGFGEARQQKMVCLLDCNGRDISIEEYPVPVFQRLETIRGDVPDIEQRIEELKQQDDAVWLEIHYTGDELVPDLRQRLDEQIEGSQIEILRLRNNRVVQRVLGQMHEDESLDDLDVNEVFQRCLLAHEIPEQQQKVLQDAYHDVVKAVRLDHKRVSDD